MSFDEVFKNNTKLVCKLINEGEFTKTFSSFDRIVEILNVTRKIEPDYAIKLLREIINNTDLTDDQCIFLLLHLDLCFNDHKSLDNFLKRLPTLLRISPHNIFTSIYEFMMNTTQYCPILSIGNSGNDSIVDIPYSNRDDEQMDEEISQHTAKNDKNAMNLTKITEIFKQKIIDLKSFKDEAKVHHRTVRSFIKTHYQEFKSKIEDLVINASKSNDFKLKLLDKLDVDIKSPVDKEDKEKMQSCIHFFAQNNNIKAVKWLIDKKKYFDHNFSSPTKFNILMAAYSGNIDEVIAYLKEKPDIITDQTFQGKTAIQMRN
ncbi:hypothetical protein TVAG_063170 [Trichomonas vaginalis G3]|uniref:Uncharacterized protein n=1 Tax=Trichomonas vaginalis (strain ATCC PRA-98 / G3) TaxID=412133 RepID=A2DLS9_TRIV3|nr:hypothetical protein TVAGG3_0581520 [Trichomonas vaginalis G3]EAY18712.1 hypothetical protein TVAG_063170 [Trichomonas vaginalis G3]KAI5522616.1 hypothetical protein TVAGG3_0581520 [Trichomonas vaginalis G3]|eukprot:XP_001579698.1 hypothetical protein [Trichomonas vaginalis G3]